MLCTLFRYFGWKLRGIWSYISAWAFNMLSRVLGLMDYVYAMIAHRNSHWFKYGVGCPNKYHVHANTAIPAPPLLPSRASSRPNTGQHTACPRSTHCHSHCHSDSQISQDLNQIADDDDRHISQSDSPCHGSDSDNDKSESESDEKHSPLIHNVTQSHTESESDTSVQCHDGIASIIPHKEVLPPAAITPEWMPGSTWQSHCKGRVLTRRAQFRTLDYMIGMLPESSHNAVIEFVIPRSQLLQLQEQEQEQERQHDQEQSDPVADSGSDLKCNSNHITIPIQNDTRIVLQTAATGDHGFENRRKNIAIPLAENYSIASVILEIPYYGCRKPEHQIRHFLPEFIDLYSQGRTTVEESRSLLAWLHHDCGFTRLGVTGISMGGSVSGIVARVATFPIAVCTFIGSHSPAPVFTRRLISRGLPWSELAREMEFESEEHAIDAVEDFLDQVGIHSLPLNDTPIAMVQVSGVHDHFIGKESSERLYQELSNQIGPDGTYAEMHWLPGGHVSSVVFFMSRYRDAIKSSFDILDRIHADRLTDG
jgi:Alpha/beta hydrolase domain containing 18